MSIRMAQRYEKAWHELYYALPKWKQRSIIEEPDGRCATELAHETAKIAENIKESPPTPTEK